MNKVELTTINSMSSTGHGIADNGWYILGGYTGDVVRAKSYKHAEGATYAELVEIVTESKHRTHTPTEKPFYDPNAPWAHLSQEQENIEKQTIVREVFQNIAGTKVTSKIHRNNDLRRDHYRNKVSYSFTLDKKKQISFALYSRGTSGVEKTVYTDNTLVHEDLNHTGRQFLEFFRQRKVPLESLKYLTLRYSYYTTAIVAHILVASDSKKDIPWKKLDLKTFLDQQQNLSGVLVSYSKPGIRSALVEKDFYSIGDINTTEEILGNQYQYHPSQFFQIYPKSFANILKACREHIEQISGHENYLLVDMLSGVGVIGLHLADLVKSIQGVEQSPLSREYSMINAELNDVSNAEFIETKAEDAIDYIKSQQILVVDPPRSGLTKSIAGAIVGIQPEYLIYISCNPETQARDYSDLKSLYDITWSQGYNLFPKTPHIEHVLILQKKKSS